MHEWRNAKPLSVAKEAVSAGARWGQNFVKFYGNCSPALYISTYLLYTCMMLNDTHSKNVNKDHIEDLDCELQNNLQYMSHLDSGDKLSGITKICFHGYSAEPAL